MGTVEEVLRVDQYGERQGRTRVGTDRDFARR